MITQETIGKILDEADIVDVIADFLGLTLSIFYNKNFTKNKI